MRSWPGSRPARLACFDDGQVHDPAGGEAHRAMSGDRSRVVGKDVQEGHNAALERALRQRSDQPARQPLAAMSGVGADRADFDMPGKAQAFAPIATSAPLSNAPT